MMMKKHLSYMLGSLWFCMAASAYAGADIKVDKSADNIRPVSGDTVVYTLTVSNPGDTDATGVNVTDQLPTGVAYVGDDEPNSQYNASSGVWNVGTVTAGGQKILNITVLIN